MSSGRGDPRRDSDSASVSPSSRTGRATAAAPPPPAPPSATSDTVERSTSWPAGEEKKAPAPSTMSTSVRDRP